MARTTKQSNVSIKQILSSMSLSHWVSTGIPLLIITPYCVMKFTDGSLAWWITLIASALVILLLVIVVSANSYKTNRSFYYRIYSMITGNGQRPLQLATCALALVFFISVGFYFLDLGYTNGTTPSNSMIRFVEVDLYWSIVSFFGASDNTIVPIGFGKLLTLTDTISGFLFLGLYISILVNRYSSLTSSNTSQSNALPSDKPIDVETQIRKSRKSTRKRTIRN